MIGSAKCSRSYGFTHGSIGAHALVATSSAAATAGKRYEIRMVPAYCTISDRMLFMY